MISLAEAFALVPLGFSVMKNRPSLSVWPAKAPTAMPTVSTSGSLETIWPSAFVPDHLGEGAILRSSGNTDDQPGILDGQKAFRDVREGKAGGDQGAQEERERDAMMAQRHIQRPLVSVQQGIEGALRQPIETPVTDAFFRTEKARAHHGVIVGTSSAEIRMVIATVIANSRRSVRRSSPSRVSWNEHGDQREADPRRW